jgi:hypothetical protein
MKKIEIVLPFFCGFYNSILDSFIDSEIEMELEESGKTYEEIEDNLDYQCARIEMSKAWLNVFNRETGFNIEFKEIDSPREYNFTTDKLVGMISVDEVREAMDKCKSNSDIFQEVLDRYFRSYDGFISFYSNDINDWFNHKAEDLDCNETMAYIAGAILSDMDENDLLDTIYDTSSVYEAAQFVWK